MIVPKKRGRPPKVKTEATEPTEQPQSEPKGECIYRSKNPFCIGLKIPKVVQVRQPNGTHADREIMQRVQVRFDDVLHTLVVNEALAKALDTDVDALNYHLKKWPSYGVGFVQVAGPGFKASESVLTFDRASMKTVEAKKGKTIIQGAKSSSNVS